MHNLRATALPTLARLVQRRSVMIFEQLNDGACKTYLIACEETREAMLVDPVLERVDVYLDDLRRRKLGLRQVLDTHVHADHISGGPALRDRAGADYVMHTLSASACANVRVDDGDELRVGRVRLQVVHTPGHTQDSITLVLPDRIITGDFLFIGEGGAGRTDLPGGDAGEHWDALQKLRALPDATLVFPAHDYHGRASSTLAEERRKNPRLLPRSREDYVTWLGTLRLGPAAWMADVIKANYACARDPRAAWIPVDQPTCEVKGTAGNVNAELVKLTSAEALADALRSGQPPLVLDVRQPEELVGELGHIAGALPIPVGDLPRRLSDLAGREGARVVTVCRSGGRSATAAAILSVAGFKDVRSLEGGMQRWNELALPVDRQPVQSKMVGIAAGNSASRTSR
jgi:glyoxylase-like metal-dependent hydrolase (beta-lactamase superfamily II)/rhodanese-related sulfurtransferase